MHAGTMLMRRSPVMHGHGRLTQYGASCPVRCFAKSLAKLLQLRCSRWYLLPLKSMPMVCMSAWTSDCVRSVSPSGMLSRKVTANTGAHHPRHERRVPHVFSTERSGYKAILGNSTTCARDSQATAAALAKGSAKGLVHTPKQHHAMHAGAILALGIHGMLWLSAPTSARGMLGFRSKNAGVVILMPCSNGRTGAQTESTTLSSFKKVVHGGQLQSFRGITCCDRLSKALTAIRVFHSIDLHTAVKHATATPVQVSVLWRHVVHVEYHRSAHPACPMLQRLRLTLLHSYATKAFPMP